MIKKTSNAILIMHHRYGTPKEKPIPATIEKMLIELQKLKPGYERYIKIQNIYLKAKKQEDSRNFNRRLGELQSICKYVEPEYPNDNTEFENGSAEFTTKAVADELLKMLRSHSYTFGYDLKWHGPGKYTISPSSSRDHDGDLIYTATFTKNDE